MKKFISLLFLIPVMAFATVPAETEFALNRLNGVARKYSLGTLIQQTKNLAVGKYSYAVQGGAVGNINLLSDLNDSASTVTIPDNAVIQNAWVDVYTTPGSTVGSIKIELVNDADLLAGTSVASIANRVQGIPDYGTISDWLKLSADKTLKIEVVDGALISGRFNVYVEYVLGD